MFGADVERSTVLTVHGPNVRRRPSASSVHSAPVHVGSALLEAKHRGGSSIDVLVVCTAGRCRSPIAAALLNTHAQAISAPLQARSGALVGAHGAMPPVGITLMHERGFDLGGHRSVPAGPESIGGADLVLVMDPEQVHEVTSRDPEAQPKTFTFAEFVRCAEQADPRGRHQRLRDWLEQVNDMRDPDAQPSSADEIVDPYGQRPGVWRTVIAQLDDLAERAATLLAAKRRPALH